MEVLDCLGNDLEELPSFLLLQPVLLFRQQIVVERVSPSVLLNEVNLCACFDGLDQPSYHWVV